MIINVFLWSHVRHLNLVERNHQTTTKEDKEIVCKLDYKWLIFLSQKKYYC